MNFDTLKRTTKTIHIDAVTSGKDTRYEGVLDKRHLDHIAELLEVSGGKLKDTPIVDRAITPITARHGLRALAEYYAKHNTPVAERLVSVEVLPVTWSLLNNRDSVLLKAWSASFDIVGDCDAKLGYTPKDLRFLIREMALNGLSNLDIEKALPKLSKTLVQNTIKKVRALVVQDKIISAVRAVIAAQGNLQPGTALKQQNLDPRKYIKAFKTRYLEMTASATKGNGFLMDNGHLRKFYSKAANQYAAHLDGCGKTWNTAYHEGTLYIQRSSRAFTSELWRELMENEERLLKNNLARLNDAKARMEDRIGKKAKAASIGL